MPGSMPSAEMCTITTMNTNNPIKGPEFNISSKDVEGLVLEIKENLRLSATTTFKAIPCSHLSRKSSRASPYRVPGRYETRDSEGMRKNNKSQDSASDDPYELLQQLLREGGLVSEAVRRVNMGLTTKQRYFYESDEETSPVLRYYSEN